MSQRSYCSTLEITFTSPHFSKGRTSSYLPSIDVLVRDDAHVGTLTSLRGCRTGEKAAPFRIHRKRLKHGPRTALQEKDTNSVSHLGEGQGRRHRILRVDHRS